MLRLAAPRATLVLCVSLYGRYNSGSMKNAGAMTIFVYSGIFLAGILVTEAARESMYVEEDGISFQVARYEDGRSKPFRVIFTTDGARSVYNFKTAGFVSTVKVGSERYKVSLLSSSAIQAGRKL